MRKPLQSEHVQQLEGILPQAAERLHRERKKNLALIPHTCIFIFILLLFIIYYYDDILILILILLLLIIIIILL
jgi:hypothetical protein